MEPRVLPLIVQPGVLFPGATLPLRLTRTSHRQLVKTVVESDRLVGVVSVPPLFGAEEPLARAGQVGCLARVVSVRKLPGRQVRIVVRGLERFSITTQPVSDPWQQASVAPYVDFDESATLLSSFADEVRQYFIRYQRASGKIGDARPERASKLPEDPAELSMLLPALLSLDDETSQRFLASRSTLMRLRELAAVLGPAVLTAESSAEVHSRSRTNGHGVKRS